MGATRTGVASPMQTRGARAALVLLATAALLVLPTVPRAESVPTAVTATGPRVVDTISLPDTRLYALAVYEPANRLFVTDDKTGELLVIDGSSRQVLSSAPVGHNAWSMVVNETAGKVYVASSRSLDTRYQGTGEISVIDADTGGVITTLHPAGCLPAGYRNFVLANDEVRDRIYVSYDCGLGVIDTTTDEYTPIGDVLETGGDYRPIAINTVTNEVFAYPDVVDGDTLTVQPFDVDGVNGRPMDVAVNERENKVYLTTAPDVLGVTQGIWIIDRDTGAAAQVGKRMQGLGPLVFNKRTNTLFAGVGVGERGAIVDGATDDLRFVNLKGNGMFAGAVRSSTNNAYFVSTDKTHVVDGRSRVVTLPTGRSTGGGFFIASIAIDQTRGLVYVVNVDRDGIIHVIRDGPIPPLPDTIITSGPSGQIDGYRATFRFKATVPDATFRCKIDFTWKRCTSPKTYRNLFPGWNTFKVRAVDAYGRSDPTPATRRFRTG